MGCQGSKETVEVGVSSKKLEEMKFANSTVDRIIQNNWASSDLD